MNDNGNNIAKMYIDILEDKITEYERLLDKILREAASDDSILSIVVQDLIFQFLKKNKNETD